jgi:DmsE family decaheme c-type cytochrome
MKGLWYVVGRYGRQLSFLSIPAMLLGVARMGAEEVPAASGDATALAVSGTALGRIVPDTLTLHYVGVDSCESCHRPETLGFAATRRGELLLEFPRTATERLGCEACHGPGSQHAAVEGRERTPGFLYFDRDDPAPLEVRNAACLQCHSGSGRMYWPGSAHESRDLACTDCHRVMTDVSEGGHLKRASVGATCAGCHIEQVRRQEMSLSRMPAPEGKLDCTNCHNAHGTPGERLLVGTTVNETCLSCHLEKRGPFLWEHAPVSESCTTCHDPHGSRNADMLAMPMPRLCQQCHIATDHPSAPQVSTARFVVGRQCANCHIAVHGSNHPSGIRLVR